MLRKPIKPFLLLLVAAILSVSLFALVACNGNPSSSQDDDSSSQSVSVPDHSALFKFIPNDDGQSYMARFAPDVDPDSDYNHIIPSDLYIPSSYCGFPVTSFFIGNMTDLTYEKISRIKNIYIPESITGGTIHWIDFYSPYKFFTIKNYLCENPNVIVKTYDYADNLYIIDDMGYSNYADYLDEAGYNETYNSVLPISVRKGIILIPYEA